MIIKKYNESTNEADLVWIYTDREVRNALGLWVANGMVKHNFEIEYYMRNHHLNNRMNSNRYKPKDKEMAEAYQEMGYVPCIDLIIELTEDIRIAITELNSLLSHMPEYVIYKVNSNVISLKQVDYPKHRFRIQNSVLSQKFTQFQALGFNPIIQKVNIDTDDMGNIRRETSIVSLTQLRNISSTNWANPHYVITLESRNFSNFMEMHQIQTLGNAANLFNEYSILLSAHGDVILEEFRVLNGHAYFILILRE